MKRVILVLLVCMLLFVVAPVSAQEGSPVIPVIDLEGTGGIGLAFLVGIVAPFVASPLTTVVVGFLKRYIFTAPDSIGGDTLALVVGVIVAILSAVFAVLGLQQQFVGVAELVFGILTVLTGTGSNLFGAGRVYTASRAYSVPIMGYSREDRYAKVA